MGLADDRYLGHTLAGRYVAEARLGDGGMGIVYSARDTLSGSRVALKVLRDRENTARFMNEARAASGIGSPHIVEVFELGRLDDGTSFFTMELLEGISLAEVLRLEPQLPMQRLIHIAKQIASGLQMAHGRGIVHRDLKPENVMLVRRGNASDFVKVLDFGIAKVGGESPLTQTGSVFGTPHYMAPEQAGGGAVDARTDIYALGVMLYRMAVGRVPFDAETFLGILTQHMHKAVPPLGPAAPPSLERVVHKALAKNPEARHASMTELIGELEQIEGSTSHRGLAPSSERSSPRPPRRVLGVLMGVSLLVIVGAASLVGLSLAQRARLRAAALPTHEPVLVLASASSPTVVASPPALDEAPSTSSEPAPSAEPPPAPRGMRRRSMPSAKAAPPPPEPATRPPSCPVTDWDPFLHQCLKKP